MDKDSPLAPALGDDAVNVGNGAALVANTTGSEMDPATAEQQLQQLQLIQLCFYEHEFGVSVDDDDDDDSDSERDVDGAADGASGVGAARGVMHDFDALAFIDSKVSHGVTLEDLCKDLTFYMDYIKEKISHHVNNDMHTAFVDVSARLSGMEDELEYVERPLVAAIKKTTTACEQLATAADAVDVKLRHASDMEEERVFDVSFLKCLVLYEEIAASVEDEITPMIQTALASARATAAAPNAAAASPRSPGTPARSLRASSVSTQQSPGPSGRDGAGAVDAVAVTTQLTSSVILERVEAVALSTRQLQAATKMLPALSQRTKEREELVACADEAKAAVFRLLRILFENLFSCFLDNPEAAGLMRGLKDVTQIYAKMRATDAFCTMFREAVLSPFLERVLPWKAASQARQSTDETVRLLERLERELRGSVTVFFPLLRRCFSAEMPLNPAANILWPVLCEVLVKKLVTLYEVGIPDAFLRKYKAAYRLLALAEECCVTPEELHTLRQSLDVIMWNHKWNVDVYAAVRLNEMGKRLEVAIAPYRTRQPVAALLRAPGSPDAAAKAAVPTFGLEVFACLFEEVTRLFSEDVFLLVCVQKFLRRAVTSAEEVSATVLPYVKESLERAQQQSQKSGGSEDTMSTEDAVALLARLMADASVLARSATADDGPLRLSMHRAIAANAGSAAAAAELREAANGVLEVLASRVCNHCVEEAQRLMTHSVVEESVAALQNAKSVRSAYSHTKKPLPTAPSWYVSSMTEPIVRFARAAVASGVPAPSLAEMVHRIVDAVAGQFTVLARETLITAKKTEESWEKLRRKKETVASAASGSGGEGLVDGSPTAAVRGHAERPTAETATDRDKMTVQLYLDAKALEDAVSALAVAGVGGRTTDVEALFALLRRAEWILGANIPEPPEIEE